MTCLTKFAVYPPNEFIHHCSQILVFFYVLPAWHCNLHEDNLANPFWMTGKKNLQGMQFLWDTLDIVKTVNADHQLGPAKFVLQTGNAILHLATLQALCELIRINSDGKCPDRNMSVTILDTTRRGHHSSMYV